MLLLCFLVRVVAVSFPCRFRVVAVFGSLLPRSFFVLFSSFFRDRRLTVS